MPCGSPYNATMTMASGAAGGREHDNGGGEGGTAAAVAEEAVVPPGPPLLPVQFWLPGFLAHKASVGHSSGDDDRQLRRRHCDRASSVSSATLSSLAASSHLPPPPVVPCAWCTPRVRVYTCVSGHRSKGRAPPRRARETGHARCGRMGAMVHTFRISQSGVSPDQREYTTHSTPTSPIA